MARVVVFFGPPAIGKSYSLEVEKRKKKYRNCQIVSIDKDVLNKYFFDPPLVKIAENSPTDILWKTASHLVGLLSSNVNVFWEQKGTRGESEIVIFLQGVTIGGIESDIKMLLEAGFSIEFVLLTVENPAILSKRIIGRAKDTNFIGAPPIPQEELSNLSKSCNLSIVKIIESLQKHEVDGEKNSSQYKDFYDILKIYKSVITYRIELTRFNVKGIDISNLNGLDFEDKIRLDIYNPDDIQIEDTSIILGKDSVSQFILKTG